MGFSLLDIDRSWSVGEFPGRFLSSHLRFCKNNHPKTVQDQNDTSIRIRTTSLKQKRKKEKRSMCVCVKIEYWAPAVRPRRIGLENDMIRNVSGAGYCNVLSWPL
jgi:hypothetical protein